MEGNSNTQNKIQVKNKTWVQESLTFGYYEFEISRQTINKKGHFEEIIFKRRFSEIEWLHNNLLKYASGCKIPNLPEKNFMTNLIKNDSLINQRKQQIESYLNYLNNHRFLSQHDFFIKFFSQGFEKERSDIQSKRSYFQSVKDYLGYSSQGGSKVMEYDEFYEKEKFSIQRLTNGVRETAKTIEDYKQVFWKKNSSITKIRELMEKIETFSEGNSQVNSKLYTDTNQNFLESMCKAQEEHITAINKIQEELETYLSEVELIEEIFKRLDIFRATEEIAPEERAERFSEFKQQLKYELDEFRKNIEGKITNIIKEFFDEKLRKSEQISKIGH